MNDQCEIEDESCRRWPSRAVRFDGGRVRRVCDRHSREIGQEHDETEIVRFIAADGTETERQVGGVGE